MPTEPHEAAEVLIYPIVRQAVARVARVAAWCAVLVGAASLAVLLGALWALVSDDGVAFALVLVGSAAEAFFFPLLLLLLCVSVLWCQYVLVAQRGWALTRALMPLLTFCAAWHAIARLCALVCGGVVSGCGAFLPWMVLMGLTVVAAMNWPLMAAAPLLLRMRIVAVPLLLSVAASAAAFLTPLAFLLLTVACALAVPLLLRLARYAPLIVSLPPRDAQEQDSAPIL